MGSLALFAIGARYEPGLLALPRLLRKGDVVLDCGANQGVYSLSAALAVGAAGRVVAVEPQRYAVDALADSIKANQLDNISIIQGAVSEKNGRATFHLNDVPVAASLVNKAGSKSREVDVWSIDDLIRRERLSHVDLIKLDVEGSEADALRGARKTIAQCEPLVLFECWDPRDASSQQAWEVLKGNGYQLYDISADGCLERVPECVRSTGLLAAKGERLGRLRSCHL